MGQMVLFHLNTKILGINYVIIYAYSIKLEKNSLYLFYYIIKDYLLHNVI